MAIWLTNQNDNKIQLAFNAIRGSWQTFGDSSQFSWLSGRKDGEGMKLIFILMSHINLCLVTIDICVLSQLLLHQVGSKAMQEGGGAVGNLVQVRSQ